MTDQITTQEIETALVEFTATEAGLADLRARFGDVIFAVDTSEGMKDARAARQEIRQPRYEVERLRKAAKAPIIALGKQIDTRAKELTSNLLGLENPIDEQIKAEEQRAEREVAEEQKRIEEINERIGEIRNTVALAKDNAETTAQVVECANDVEAIEIDDTFAEFREVAQAAKDETLAALRVLFSEVKQREKDAAELAELRREKAEREAAEKAEREAAEKAEDFEPPEFEDAPAPDVERKEITADREPAPTVMRPVLVVDDDGDTAVDFTIPTRAEMLAVLADHYGVKVSDVDCWLSVGRND